MILTDDIRALVGKPGPRRTSPHPLDANELRRFVQGVMEPSAIHFDEEAAKAAGFGVVSATPLYPVHSQRRPAGSPDPLDQLVENPDWDGTDLGLTFAGVPPLGLPLKRILNGGVSAQFHKLAQLGDTISAQAEYSDITERESSSGQPMVLVTIDTRYTNQNDELLVRVRQTLILR